MSLKSKTEGLLPYFILMLALILTAVAYHISKGQTEELSRSYFEQESQKVKTSIQERLEKYQTVLLAGKALFTASKEVSAEEWKKFAWSMDLSKNYPGMLVFGFIKYVPEENKAAFLKQANQELGQDYKIWPEGNRPEYFPILYVEPFQENQTARGFDISTESKRAEAALAARDSGEARITAKVKLVQNNLEGFLLLLPIYQNGQPHNTLAEKRKYLEGWVYGAFNVENVMRGVLPEENSLLDIEIFDGTSTGRENMIYDDDSILHAVEPNFKSLFLEKVSIPIAGHTWTFYISTRPEFSRIVHSNKPNFILFGGGLSSFLLFLLFKSLFSTRKRALKLAEKMSLELHQSNLLNKAILDSANLSIISTQTDGIITSFNLGAEKMLGYSAEEVIGKYSPTLFHDPTEISEYAQKLSQKTGEEIQGLKLFVIETESGASIEREWTYIRKDGSRLPVSLSISTLRDENGKVNGYLGIATDITERKRIDKMKNEFISTVSHELRTPLTSIRGSLGLLNAGMAGEIPKKAKDFISIALNNCERLIRLINDILDIEKMESGKMEFHPAKINMVALVQQSLEINKNYADSFKIKLVFETPATSPLFVFAEADKILQVLTNLISNAVKFSRPKGTVTIRILKEKNKVRVEIEDHGQGIPESFQKNIFKKFSQVDSSDNRQKGGTGLGLSISKAIIEKSGGKIDYRTKEGEGSVFYFELAES